MDALELLNERIDIIKLMKHYNFEQMNDGDTYVRACCALHGGNEPTAFVANVENGRWYCHSAGCGGGDAYTLVQRKEECSFTDSVRWLANFFEVEIGDVEVFKRKSKEEAELKKWIKAIQARRKRPLEEYHINTDVLSVRKFRDFLPETLEHFGLKWVDTFDAEKRDGGRYTLRNRLLFPIIQRGVLVGVSLRRVISSHNPKWSHQPIRMRTGDILYNYDITLEDVGSVTVVEGLPDVWAYYEIGIAAVATFGAHLTDQQLKLLLKSGKDVVLSFDGDEAGRLATEKAIEQMKLTTNLSVVPFKDGEDPANITREELMTRYEQRK